MASDWQSPEDYVLFCRGRLADPHPLYHRLRSEDPLHCSEQADSWVLTRYDDVRFALRHHPRLTAERLSLLSAQLPQEVQAEVEPLCRLLSTWMQYYDPPDHTRLRSLVNRAFTPGITERRRDAFARGGGEQRVSPCTISGVARQGLGQRRGNECRQQQHRCR